MSEPAVHVESLSKTYRSGFLGRDTVRALRSVDLTVDHGEIFGLLGPNGAGKTTLLKILLGIAFPSEGRATLFGQSVDNSHARSRIGFLPEKHRFPDFLTAEQMLHLYGRLSGVAETRRNKRIPELLDQVGMTQWRDTKIKKYSKGMMQRVGLAQALMNEPDLVFLDEPTDGVDPVGRREIRDLLLWLYDEGKTIFLNSHLLSEVEKVCTRVAILHEGQLVRQGTVEELTTSERIYDLIATAVPAPLLNGAGEVLRHVEDDPPSNPELQRYRLRADDRSDLNARIDQLRSADVMIEAVHPVRRSLEDYFIDVVGQQPQPTDSQ